MNKYDKKAKRIKKHLTDHPHDYQSVISFFKANSKSIDYERRQIYNKKMGELAKIRRNRNGKQT